MSVLDDMFGDESPLREYLPGFRPRPGQAWMAEAVAATLANLDKLVVEAGTGTGKTFAYLAPALESGRKTIISTGTKALQDQLFHRDLPLIAKVLGRPARMALLKGRANYLCLHRLDNAGELPASLAGDLRAISEWRYVTESGDKAEVSDVAEDATVWPYVTSTSDNCLGQKCPRYDECFVVKARREAQEADIVVVNHHLLLADLAMREVGFVEFLPGVEAVIVDEAHQLPDLAVQFFGIALGSRELERLLAEVRTATMSVGQAELTRRIDAIDTALKKLRAAAPREEGRYEFAEVQPGMREPIDALRDRLAALATAMHELADASPEIEVLHGQVVQAMEKLALLSSDDSWDGLRWLEVNARSLRFNLTPLDVSATLSSLVDNDHQAWVFTSATLAVGEDFSHFSSRMGLGGIQALTFPSPYPVDRNGLVFLPPGLPTPSEAGHTEALLESVTPLFDATSGGVFFLFTSHRALNAARKWFRGRKRILGKRKLLVQGSAPRDDLLRRFREHGNAVLLGTGSFWEGVDVRGQALSIVAIDKLPFGSPADPLMMARIEFIRRNGGNGFIDHQVPQAVIALKQGAGRLLRDHTDFGVIVIGDPRVSTRSYGGIFLDSLAPMPVTASTEEAADFLRAHEAEGAVA